jgi:hypothetical protein
MSADDGDVRVEHEFDQLVREQRLHRSKPGDADRP